MSISPIDSPTTSSTTVAEDGGVPFDAHGIEPIPDGSRDCSPWELFWIWSGANIAPINWVLGALGITLGLSLVETLIVVVAGNLFGCAVFGVFNVIGHRTAVNQMVRGRAPFGRRGSIVPGVGQFFLTMGWVGVNTWVVLDLVMAILAEVGVSGGGGLGVAAATTTRGGDSVGGGGWNPPRGPPSGRGRSLRPSRASPPSAAARSARCLPLSP